MVLNGTVSYLTVIIPVKGTRNAEDTDFAKVIVGDETGGFIIKSGSVESIRIVHTSKKDNGDIHYTIAIFQGVTFPTFDRRVAYIASPLVADLDVSFGNSQAAEVENQDGEFLQLRSKTNKEATYDLIAISFTTAAVT